MVNVQKKWWQQKEQNTVKNICYMDWFATTEEKEIQNNDFIWCWGYITKEILHAVSWLMPINFDFCSW